MLWASYGNRGGSHASSAFHNSDLYDLLVQKELDLFEANRFILGDSAYAIESFIISPYDNATKKSAEDNFNFFHSSARITIECAFGEIDLRWGIFWKRLTLSLENNIAVISSQLFS